MVLYPGLTISKDAVPAGMARLINPPFQYAHEITDKATVPRTFYRAHSWLPTSPQHQVELSKNDIYNKANYVAV